MVKPKRGLVISDLHSGHKIVFTHPKHDHETETNKKLFAHRRLIWDWTIKEAEKRGPYDFMIVNGDCIDGRGDKSGGFIGHNSDDSNCVAIT